MHSFLFLFSFLLHLGGGQKKLEIVLLAPSSGDIFSFSIYHLALFPPIFLLKHVFSRMDVLLLRSKVKDINVMWRSTLSDQVSKPRT